MKYMEIGRSGIKASVITMGAMGIGGGTWWRNSDDDESVRTIHRALELGINTIDTAPVYGFGHSEEVIGKAIKGRRSEYIISTKCGLWWDDDEGSFRFEKDGHRVTRNLTSHAIRTEIERSLKRLGTDYIDIYYTHNPACPPVMTPVEETVGTLMELKKEGKIRAIGASNMTPDEIRAYTSCGEIDIIQGHYSMLDRSAEKEIIPLCRELGLSFHGYMPLERGLLTGKTKADYKVQPGDAREDSPLWKPDKFPEVLGFVDGLKDICEKYHCTQPQLAVAFLLARGSDINVICGARRVFQIEDTALAADVELDESDVKEILDRMEKIGL
ncbi:aldo/keto reductase [Eubacterium sp. ER2]|uniref:aldo/keto reductase n=1 Tax=Eubacterium sp. ER2 TaxID=1519438 RepID=UPI00051BD6C8|nr:aldo/keto reductase [Eubacterium sp. ER2]